MVGPKDTPNATLIGNVKGLHEGWVEIGSPSPRSPAEYTGGGVYGVV